MKKRVMAGLGLACLACCMPLIVPMLGAAGMVSASGWLGGLTWSEIACIGLVAAMAAGALVFVLRRRRRKVDGPYCDGKE